MDICITFSQIASAFLVACVVSLFALIFVAVANALKGDELSSQVREILGGIVIVGLVVGGSLALALYFGFHHWFVLCPN